jgi:hypothetical protein
MQRGLFRWASILMLGLAMACGEPSLDESQGGASEGEMNGQPDAEGTPGLLSADARRNLVEQGLASPNALTPMVTESGFITLSVDGLGTTATTGIVEAQKPAGATVRRAFLMGASTGGLNFQIPNGNIRIDGQAVNWSRSVPSSIGSWNHFGEVTALVKPRLDAAPAGRVAFTITETSTANIDGTILAVIFDNPAETTVNTAILLFGAQSTTGDTFNISLAEPINKNDPNLALDLSLGISFGFQTGTLTEGQRSTVDINGARMSSQAGGQDDGSGNNGALLTVGGLDDTNANPPPLAAGPGFRGDDELYDLKPFVAQGSRQIVINTFNASNDDNIFFAALSLRSAAAVVGEGIVLGPTQSSGEVGTSHTVTATLQDDLGRPVANRAVSFSVLSGPNAGRSGSAVTDSTGRASFTYAGTGGPGRDSIRASFVNSSGVTATSNLALRDWTQTRRPPVAQCRNLNLDAGLTCGVSGSVNNGSSDPDGDLVGCTQSPAGPFNLGTTSVTLTCTDSTGLSSSCSATVTVVDRTRPSISCPANQSAECVDGGALVAPPSASASDNCGAVTVQNARSGFYPLGTSTLSYLATDSSGNTQGCSSLLTVRDTQAPTLTPVGPVYTSLECNVDTYVELGATASDVCAGGLSSYVTTSGGVNTSQPGSYAVTYSVVDRVGLGATATRAVSVQDTLPPSVALVGPASASLECNGGTFNDPGATASDVCAGDLTGGIVRTGAVNAGAVGSYTLRYTATDAAGLSASVSRTVSVVDTQGPSIVCPGPQFFEAPTSAGAQVTPAAATASDLCGVASVTGPAAGVYTPGIHEVTYTATDAAGQSASCTSLIVVVDRSAPPPKLTMCDTKRYTNDATVKACGFVLPGGSGAPITYAFIRVNGGAPIRVQPEASGGMVQLWLPLAEGTYTIELTAIDAQGGIATDTRIVTVDRTPPAIRIVSPRPDETQPSQLLHIISEVTDVAPSTVTTNWIHRTDVDEGTQLVDHAVYLPTTGYNQVIVHAVDAAGNAASVKGLVYVAEE